MPASPPGRPSRRALRLAQCRRLYRMRPRLTSTAEVEPEPRQRERAGRGGVRVLAQVLDFDRCGLQGISTRLSGDSGDLVECARIPPDIDLGERGISRKLVG